MLDLTKIMPKGEGLGLMCSFIVSREHRFEWELTKAQLKKVNKYRENKVYCDEKAAIDKLGKKKNDKLKISPFKRKIQYGAAKEGYWSYEDMFIQVEDCIDCLNALYGNSYQYLFLFDHSNGHGHMSPNELSTNTIKNYMEVTNNS